MTPLVSVIIPTFNRPVLLNESLASIESQTFTDWEVIIVDDASEEPVAIKGDGRIRVFRHALSQGGAAAKNTGINASTAEIIAFLDDDDLYAPQYLERALGVLERNPDLDVVFMGCSWFGATADGGQRNYNAAMAKTLQRICVQRVENSVIFFDETLLDALLLSVPMAFQRPVVRKRALQVIGLYRPECLLWDCDWAISASLNARTALINEGLYLQRAEGQGYSSRGDRRLDHLASGIEIKDRLLHDARNGVHPQHLVPKFRKATAMAWFDLAWHHYQQGDRLQAFHALWCSARKQIFMANAKLLFRLLWSIK